MKVHTRLTAGDVRAALDKAIENGHVAANVTISMVPVSSRSHDGAHEVRLFATTRDAPEGGYASPGATPRKFRPHASGGGYSASWAEWGWFLANVFAADPAAKAGPYKSAQDFHDQTYEAFKEDEW